MTWAIVLASDSGLRLAIRLGVVIAREYLRGLA